MAAIWLAEQRSFSQTPASGLAQPVGGASLRASLASSHRSRNQPPKPAAVNGWPYAVVRKAEVLARRRVEHLAASQAPLG